jgi:hypothetical protein
VSEHLPDEDAVCSAETLDVVEEEVETHEVLLKDGEHEFVLQSRRHDAEEPLLFELDHHAMHIGMLDVVDGAVINIIVQLHSLQLVDLIEHVYDLILLLNGEHSHGLRILEGQYAGWDHWEDDDGYYLLKKGITHFILVVGIEVSIAHCGWSSGDVVDGCHIDIQLRALQIIISQDINPAAWSLSQTDPHTSKQMEDDAKVEERLGDFQEVVKLLLLIGKVLSEVLSKEINHLVHAPNVDEPYDLCIVAARVSLDSYNTWDHWQQINGKADEEGSSHHMLAEYIRDGRVYIRAFLLWGEYIY